MPSRVVDPRPALPTSEPSPQAARIPRARWLDARLLVGVGLVLASVVLGARVVSGADDTVGVWAARADLAAGDTVTPADLVEHRVRLDAGVDRYVAAGTALADGLVLTRPVAEGELLPARALADRDAADVRYVTVSVPRAELPAGAAKGSRVDVWVAPSALDRATSEKTPGTSTLLLGGAAVEGVQQDESAFGSGDGDVPVVLAITAAAAHGDLEGTVAEILTASRGGRLYLVGVPASAR